jgi:hypothetical protein
MLSNFISIPETMSIPGDNLLHWIRNVYSDIASSVNDPKYFVGRAILIAKNKDTKDVNSLLLDCRPSRNLPISVMIPHL